jgi:Tol biopolymer transport system component
VVREIDSSATAMYGPNSLAWTPDSKWIAFSTPRGATWPLVAVSIDTGEERRLTAPPIGVSADDGPSFSPDGRSLCFSRILDGSTRADLYVLQLDPGFRPSGEPKLVPLENPINISPAWMPDGRELLFFSGKGDALTLFRTVLSKTSAVRRFPVTSHASGGNKLAVSLLMNRLAYAQIHSDVDLWRLELTDNGRIQSPPVPFISSTKPDFEPEYSPDGRRIAFTSSRSGVNQIWVCDSDGLNPVQLTSYGGEVLYGPRWSRDGQQIGFNVEGLKGAPTQIYVVNANGGRPKRLQTPTAWAQWPNWCLVGQWI